MDDDLTEVWVPVAGWEDAYEVSDLGRVRSLDRIQEYQTTAFRVGLRPVYGVVLASAPDTYGYKIVVLKVGPRRKTANVAHLVARAFLGDRPSGRCVAHRNGVRDDDRAANLYYATNEENERDKVLHGRGMAGRTGLSWRLNDEERDLLRKNAFSWSKVEVARIFGVTPSLVVYYRHAVLKRPSKV